RNVVSLSVLGQTREMWPKSASAISEPDFLRIVRTKFLIISLLRSKKEWAWVSRLFDPLLRRTAAQSQRKTRPIAARAWSSVCRQLVATFKRARRRHDRRDTSGSEGSLRSG